ncbi:DUF6302 family protein [Streptomyces virginiae]|uniref:DUF6302 family protein n=1 Tax=Streptomyces virginiae TaxID=1961 RepID=UPI00366732A0
MNQRSSAYPSLVLGPAREAVDYEWYRERLTDPALADRGISISVFRLPLLAVPVGGDRWGGCYSAAELVVAIAVRRALAGRAGYPHVRLDWSSEPGAWHKVIWGMTPPRWGDQALGHHYGYSEAAIAAYVHNAAPGPASPPLSPSACS